MIEMRSVEEASCQYHIGLARIKCERKRLSSQGKGSDCDVRYEWRDVQSFHAMYAEQVSSSTGFYFEVIDCERPCVFYASFPVCENTCRIEWLDRYVTPRLTQAVQKALPPNTAFPTRACCYWSDGTTINVYWDQIVFTTPVMCGRFVQSTLCNTLREIGVTLNMDIYPSDEHDWTRSRLMRFPYSGKRLNGKAVDVLRPLIGKNAENNPSSILSDITRATITVTSPPTDRPSYLCVVDGMDDLACLVPKMQTLTHSLTHQGHL